MKITFITIGHSVDPYEKKWMDVYTKRLGSFASVEHRHVKDKFDLYKNRNDPKYEKWVQSLVEANSYLIVLDENGKKFSTKQLYTTFIDLELSHKDITFLIGGSYGLPSTIIKEAKLCLSLSPMTLPHKMAYLILLEQIYRCFTIKKGIPYHHE